MSLHNIYSKRQKQLRGEMPDVFTYDKLPQSLVIQIIHIVKDTVNESFYYTDVLTSVYEVPAYILRREYGVYELIDNYYNKHGYEILGFLEKTIEVEYILDAVELIFEGIDTKAREHWDNYGASDEVLSPDEAITDLNARFKEHGIGYAFEGGQIMRVDSTYTHAEIVKPTLSLLANPSFAGANEEYLKAHEHYRHGRNKECLTDCLKAFESTMKAICTVKEWDFDPARDTATKLVQICFANNLVPAFMQSHITALKSVLENGITTVRNKLSGHGQGAVPHDVEDDVARYALNLTGSNIIFLVEQSGIV